MLSRKLKPSVNNSFFLFGARGVGKSTLLRVVFDNIPTLHLDLLRVDLRTELQASPDTLETLIPKNIDWVVIDEVQKVPALLDVVHRLIESKGVKFALTGSSARKLKHGGANLLAGRAFVYNMFPFTCFELGDLFNLNEALKWGSLPKCVFLASVDEKMQYLRSYANTYLQEEVWEAHLIKDLIPYRRFLQVAAQTNGTVINYSNIASDTRVDAKTVQRYFQILEETLLGFFLEPYHRSLRKRQRANPKFYFFDVGVQRALTSDFALDYGSDSLGFGTRFEHFVICEVMRCNQYSQSGYELSFIRENDTREVDLVLSHPTGKLWFIEIKSTDRIEEKHTDTLRYFSGKFHDAECQIWSCDLNQKHFGSIAALHWQEGLKKIFNLIGDTQPLNL